MDESLGFTFIYETSMGTGCVAIRGCVKLSGHGLIHLCKNITKGVPNHNRCYKVWSLGSSGGVLLVPSIPDKIITGGWFSNQIQTASK